MLAAALAGGALVAGLDQPAARATLAAAVVAAATGFNAEHGKGAAWVVRSGRVAAAAALPFMGVRAHLTGGAVTDALVTALLALVLMAGVRSIEHSDGTAPVVTGLVALGFLLVAVRIEDPVAPLAAALVGGCAAMAANTWPPAVVRIGAIGPTVLGAAMAAIAVAVQPEIAAPRTMLVPVLALLVLAVAAVVPAWDRRLSHRSVRPEYLLPISAIAGAVAADGMSRGALGIALAVALAGAPVALLALVGLSAPRPRPTGWEPHRGRTLAAGALAVVVSGAIAATAGMLLVDARRSLELGRELATAGLDAARDGDLPRSQELFERADVAFADGSASLRNPVVRVGELLPVLGTNLRSARTMAAVGGDLSSTAVAVAERAGADDLRVVDGRFPVEGAEAVGEELAIALATLRRSSLRIEAVESPLLLSEVREGSRDVGVRIADATRSFEVVAEATRLAPALLGADGDRRWMVAILNPSEQRGAGGLAGDFAELRASNGDVDLVRSISAAEMNQATDHGAQLAALPSVYRTRYEGFRPGRFWQNLSATPDVPTLARGMAEAFPLTVGGGRVDGVITIDPYGIAALLELTGPVIVPGWPAAIGSDNVERILLFDHYDVLSPEQIDTFQGDVVEAVVDALTEGTLPAPSVIAATLTPAVQGGHLRLWSPERDAQALFERIGADGSLRAPADGTDFIQLVTQSASESKIDWFLRRSLTYAPVLDPTTGVLTATATVTLANAAPTTGVSSYIIGEADGPTAVGENELRLTLYSPHRPTGVTDAAGTSLPINIGMEQGLFAVTALVEIPSGQSITLSFRFVGALRPSRGLYELRVGRQPAVAPDAVEVDLEGSAGWVFAGGEPDPAALLTEVDTQYVGHLER